MPKVPQYQQQVQSQTAPVLTNTPQGSVDYGNEKVNEALGVAAKIYDEQKKIYDEQKKKADQVSVYEADAKLTALETDMLHNPKSGALNQKGKNSFGTLETVSTEFKARSEEIMAGLTNEEQKAEFKKSILAKGLNIDRSLQSHVSIELVRYDSQVTEASLAAERNAAIKNYADPSRVEQSLVKQERALRDFGLRNGVSNEQLEQQILDTKSKTHEEILNRMLSGDQDIQAKDYYEKNKNDFSPEKMASIEKTIEIGSTRSESQRLADSYLKAGKSEEQAYESASKISDPKLREATEERINRGFKLKKSVEDAALEKNHIEALNIIDQTGDFNKIPPEQINKMDFNKRNQLKKYAEDKAAGKVTKTDAATFYKLKLMSSGKDTQEKFALTDLTDYINVLSDKDWKDMVSDQVAIRNKDPKIETKLDGFMSDQAIINEGFEKSGLDSKKNKDELYQYNMIIDKEVAVQAKLKGSKLNNDEIREIVNNFTREVVTKENKFWSDTKKKVFELQPEEIKNIKYTDVPNSEKLKIEKFLKKNGQEPSQEKVRQLYIKKLLR